MANPVVVADLGLAAPAPAPAASNSATALPGLPGLAFLGLPPLPRVELPHVVATAPEPEPLAPLPAMAPLGAHKTLRPTGKILTVAGVMRGKGWPQVLWSMTHKPLGGMRSRCCSCACSGTGPPPLGAAAPPMDHGDISGGGAISAAIAPTYNAAVTSFRVRTSAHDRPRV